MFRRLSVFVIVIILFAGCFNQGSSIKVSPPSTYFEIDNPPVPTNVTGNPLDYASHRIGLDFASFTLPDLLDGGYRCNARLPIIDYVGNSTLFMKSWTEQNAKKIRNAHKQGLLSTLQATITTLTEDPNKKELNPKFNFKYAYNALKDSGLSEKYKNILSQTIFPHFLFARQLVNDAVSELSEDDLEFFKQNPGFYLVPDGKRMAGITGDTSTQQEFIRRMRKVKIDDILYASEILAKGVELYLEQIKDLQPEEYFENSNMVNQDFKVEINSDFEITGFTKDKHVNDRALIIDLGGDDVYENNAGGCGQSVYNAALCIDQAGNDVYRNETRSYVQGFGFLGIGMLVDLDGNDNYFAKHFSQATGIGGVGLIYDINGDDKYDGNGFCQGAGMFGIGLLLDNNGNDFYNTATASQGSASTLGLGVLSDLNGDDKYHLFIDKTKDPFGVGDNPAGPGFGQGGAVSFRDGQWWKKLTPYGGVGMLVDNDGDDLYHARGWCSIGGSYVMSLGALVDFKGNDHYIPNCGAGSSIHVTNAILVDFEGDDKYEGGFRVGGSGSDRSPGILIDYKGNDVYGSDRNYEMSFGVGCKPFGLSLMIDYEGDDTYKRVEPKNPYRKGFPREVFGGVWPAGAHEEWLYGLCLDLNGNDNYQVKNRKNNMERISYGHGIFLDTSWNGGDVIGDVQCPLPSYPNLNEKLNKSNNTYINQLSNPNLFKRFYAIGKILEMGEDSIPAVVDALCKTNNKQVVRDLTEVLNSMIDYKIINEKKLLSLKPVFNKANPEIIANLEYDLAINQYHEFDDEMVETLLNNPDNNARLFAAASLIFIRSPKIEPVLKQVILEDKFSEVRRVCVDYLGLVEKNNATDFILDVIKNDPDPSVKVTAIECFMEFMEPKVVESLTDYLTSYDVFIRRAASKALIINGNKDAVTVLIQSLDYPSIDDYNCSEAKYLEGFTGQFFGINERKLTRVWMQWWNKNKDSFDLKKNVEAFMKYQDVKRKIKKLSNDDKFKLYEGFLKTYSFYGPAKRDAGNFYNAIAWDLVTGNPKNRDPKLGLKYALKSYALAPSPNVADTLAEAYYINGEVEKALEISKKWVDQDKRMFQPRIKQYQKELNITPNTK